MNDYQPNPPDTKVFDAAVTLGEAIRLDRGRQGVWRYLSVLMECMPPAWVEEVAERLSMPCPPPKTQAFDPAAPDMPAHGAPPPPPRQPMDMEKILRIMQLMGNLKGS